VAEHPLGTLHQVQDGVHTHGDVGGDGAVLVNEIGNRRGEEGLSARNFPLFLQHDREGQPVLPHFGTVLDSTSGTRGEAETRSAAIKAFATRHARPDKNSENEKAVHKRKQSNRQRTR